MAVPSPTETRSGTGRVDLLRILPSVRLESSTFESWLRGCN